MSFIRILTILLNLCLGYGSAEAAVSPLTDWQLHWDNEGKAIEDLGPNFSGWQKDD